MLSWQTNTCLITSLVLLFGSSCAVDTGQVTGDAPSTERGELHAMMYASVERDEYCVSRHVLECTSEGKSNTILVDDRRPKASPPSYINYTAYIGDGEIRELPISGCGARNDEDGNKQVYYKNLMYPRRSLVKGLRFTLGEQLDDGRRVTAEVLGGESTLKSFTCVESYVDPIADLEEVPFIHVPPLSDENDIRIGDGFHPHRAFEGTGYIIEPLHPNHSEMDYAAWHDQSWDQLEDLFYRAWEWPRPTTEAENREALDSNHYQEFLARRQFSYTVLSPEGDRVLGSIYMYPGRCTYYNSFVFYWINTPDRADLEETFYLETRKWLNENWPGYRHFYPGPDLEDEERGRRYKRAWGRSCDHDPGKLYGPRFL